MNYNFQPGNYILANSRAAGFFRTKYDPLLFSAIKNATLHHQLSTDALTMVLSDMFAFANVGLSKLSEVLEFVLQIKLANIRGLTPWALTFESLVGFGGKLQSEACFETYRKYVHTVIDGFDSLQLQNTTHVSMVRRVYTVFKIMQTKCGVIDLQKKNLHLHLEKNLVLQLLQSGALMTAVTFLEPTICRNLYDSISAAISSKNYSISIDPQLRSAIYYSAVAIGGEDEWNWMLKK